MLMQCNISHVIELLINSEERWQIDSHRNICLVTRGKDLKKNKNKEKNNKTKKVFNFIFREGISFIYILLKSLLWLHQYLKALKK